MAKKEISQDEKRFINQVIGPQLKRRNESVKISTTGGDDYNINYCIVDNGDPSSFIDVIVLLAGFGSGWPGISKLAYDLVKLNYQVCMLSLPGYGNSTDPDLPSELASRWSNIETRLGFGWKIINKSIKSIKSLDRLLALSLILCMKHKNSNIYWG